jgi:hypothetical protein
MQLIWMSAVRVIIASNVTCEWLCTTYWEWRDFRLLLDTSPPLASSDWLKYEMFQSWYLVVRPRYELVFILNINQKLGPSHLPVPFPVHLLRLIRRYAASAILIASLFSHGNTILAQIKWCLSRRLIASKMCVIHGEEKFQSVCLLAYLPYSEKMKIGLCAHRALCVSSPVNFWMTQPILMELGMYIMAPEPIPTSSVCVSTCVSPYHC